MTLALGHITHNAQPCRSEAYTYPINGAKANTHQDYSEER